MKNLNEVFDDLQNDYNVAAAVAYKIEDDINAIKVEDMSYKQLVALLQRTKDSLAGVRNRMSQAGVSLEILLSYLKNELKADLTKKFDDIKISKTIDGSWKRNEKTCANVRKLDAKKRNKVPKD